LMTPFHNMALLCPFVTKEAVDYHSTVLDDCLSAIRLSS